MNGTVGSALVLDSSRWQNRPSFDDSFRDFPQQITESSKDLSLPESIAATAVVTRQSGTFGAWQIAAADPFYSGAWQLPRQPIGSTGTVLRPSLFVMSRRRLGRVRHRPRSGVNLTHAFHIAFSRAPGRDLVDQHGQL